MNVSLRILNRALPLTSSLAVHPKGHIHRWVAPTRREMQRRKEKMGPELPARRSSFIEWNYSAELYALGKRLGEEFDDNLLKQALVDRSYVEQEKLKQKEVGIEEPKFDMEDNAEMAQAGEQLIKSYVSQYLSLTLPKLPAEYRRQIQDHLVSSETLGYISKHLGLSDLIMCANFPVETPVLAQSFKSLSCALARSSGEDRACALVRDLVVTQLSGLDLTQFCTPADPMAELSSFLAKEGRGEPEPRLIAAIGRNTIIPSYDVGMYSDKEMIGRGFGESAETALEMAACDALWKAWGVGPNKRPFPFKLELPPMSKSISS